jgi:Plasmid pRiA4b ORF-3-like protein
LPPEDVGGVPGYENFLEAIRDPLHEEHDHMLIWVGYKFDPTDFDVAVANAALQRVR